MEEKQTLWTPGQLLKGSQTLAKPLPRCENRRAVTLCNHGNKQTPHLGIPMSAEQGPTWRRLGSHPNLPTGLQSLSQSSPFPDP